MVAASAAARHLPFPVSPVSAAVMEEGPSYVLEFGFAMSSLHQDLTCSIVPHPEQICTVRMVVYPDNTWTVHAGNYVKELGWENLPTVALHGNPDTSAITLMRWLAETVLYPQRFDESGLTVNALDANGAATRAR